MSTILKNADGKILRNGDGKLLKQNFNFGNCLIQATGDNPYIRIYVPNLTYISISFMGKDIVSSESSGYFQTGFESGNGIGAAKGGNPNLQMRTFEDVTYSVSGYFSGIFQFGLEIDFPNQTLHPIKNGQKLSPVGAGNILSTDSASYVDIMRGYNNPSLGQASSIEFPADNGKADEILIYSRPLSTSELKFLYNNSLYNEPISVSGLVSRIRLNSAEELDFSETQDGSDIRVGSRDSSGNNNHGELINLPAGTNQEKMDYANNNWFVTW